MQELTLTGATMHSDHPTASNSSTNSTSATTGNATITTPNTATTSTHQHQHHQNDFDHPYLMLTLAPTTTTTTASTDTGHGQHHHNHQPQKSCCSRSIPTHQPVVTLKKPIIEILQEASTYDLYQLLLQIIRFGQYDTLFVPFMEAWRAYYDTITIKTTTATSTSEGNSQAASFDEMIHSYDNHGHTITHWATKRTDDIRILQYILTNIRWSTTTTTTSQQMQYMWKAETKELVPLFLPPVSTTNVIEGGESKITTAAGAVKEMYPTPVHRPTYDNTKMTPLHWACTQDNSLSMIKLLLDFGSNSGTSTTSTSTNVTSNARINNLLEIRDGTGCTPCLIASQHGKVEIVAYLIQRGANIYAVDHARDSAIHWAAYKGSEQVLGLLSYYCSNQQFFTPDAYGQTPLHLASLRGHVSVVRYILYHLLQQPLRTTNTANRPNDGKVQLQSLTPTSHTINQQLATIRAVRDLLALKDQNGRTPYDLAVHKNKPAVAAVLKYQSTVLQQKLVSSNGNLKVQMKHYMSSFFDNIKQIYHVRTWKTWLGLPEVDDLDESPRFAFYYVIFQVMVHFFYTFTIFIPWYDVSKGVLWDYLSMLSINIVLIFVSAFTLYKCHTTNPGRIDYTFANVQYWRTLYEQTLDNFASYDESIVKQASKVQLCHTCHIARPPRSKHDRFSRSCIVQFDHHCPFVGTTVGLYNYKWFFAFIVSISIYLINFWILLFVHYFRMVAIHQGNMITLLFGIYLALHILFSGGMTIYHAQLIYENLTTNEHINVEKYDYFWHNSSGSGTSGSSRRIFYNPWNKGFLNNLYDRVVHPGDHSYMLPPSTSESNPRLSSNELHQPLVGNSMIDMV